MSKKSMVVIAAVLAVAALLGWEWLVRDADDAPARHSESRVDGVMPDAPEIREGEAPSAMDQDESDILELPEGESFSVRVQVGGKRVAGIGVVARMLGFGDPRVYQRVAFTDAEGRAAFPDMLEGQVGLWTTTGAGVWEDASKTGSVDLVDDAGISVRARVVDRDGVAVEGAVIEAAWTPGVLALPMARTDADGRAFLPHLDAGACLTARAPGWVAPPLQVLRGRGGDVVDLTFKLVETGGSARLRLVDSTGQPVYGAVAFDHAEVKPQPGETPPARSEGDDEGRVILEGLAAGTHNLIVRAPGRRPTKVSVVVTPGSVTEQTVVMERSAVVFGRVTWANADAVARIPVEQVVNPGPRSLLDAMTFCDAQGRFRLDEIASESFELQVRRPGFPAATRSFRLAPGQEQEWNVTLGEKHELRGRLMNAKGEPLAGWVVRALTPDKLQATTMTRADGGFALSVNDPEATYRLAAQPTSGNGGWTAQAEAKGTRDPVELVVRDKPKSRVLGRVVNADGKPLGGVHVMAMAVEGNGLKVVPTSHKDGRFLLSDLPAGRYRFAVIDMTGTYPTVPIGEHEYRAGEQLDLGETRVTQGGRIRIRVLLADGMRPTGAGVSEWWAGVLQGWKNEEDGARLSPLVAPGVVKVVASGILDRRITNKTVEVVVRDGETTEVTIDLRETESK